LVRHGPQGSVLYTKESDLHQVYVVHEQATAPEQQWIRTCFGDRVCGYKLGKRRGEQYRCGNADLLSDGRCLRHSKQAPRYPVYCKKKRKALHMPQDRARIVKGPAGDARERADADHRLLDLRPVIALYDMRIEEISARIADKAATPAEWKKAGSHLKQYKKAIERDDDGKMEYHLGELTKILEDGIDTEKGWEEMLAHADRRAIRTEKANDLLIKGAHMIAATDLRRFVAHVQDIIAEEARGPAATRIISRIAEECLERLAPGSTEEVADRRSILPRVQGKGTGVHEGSAGGEILEVPAVGGREPLPAQERKRADLSRRREDSSSGGLRADLPDDEGGQHRGDDGADRSPGEEPPLGGDREDAREGEGTTPGGA
jgi:hypothetical protein